jgi:hypothetical protein
MTTPLPMPSTYPQFAQNSDGTNNNVTYSNGQGNVVEPLGEEKLIGWSPDELPACNIFNWLHRLTSQWIQYLRETTDTLIGELSALTADYLTHKTATGTAVHGLGTASTHAETDFLSASNDNWIDLLGTSPMIHFVGSPSGVAFTSAKYIKTNKTIEMEIVFKFTSSGGLNSFSFELDDTGISALARYYSGDASPGFTMQVSEEYSADVLLLKAYSCGFTDNHTITCSSLAPPTTPSGIKGTLIFKYQYIT